MIGPTDSGITSLIKSPPVRPPQAGDKQVRHAGMTHHLTVSANANHCIGMPRELRKACFYPSSEQDFLVKGKLKGTEAAKVLNCIKVCRPA